MFVLPSTFSGEFTLVLNLSVNVFGLSFPLYGQGSDEEEHIMGEEEMEGESTSMGSIALCLCFLDQDMGSKYSRCCWSLFHISLHVCLPSP